MTTRAETLEKVRRRLRSLEGRELDSGNLRDVLEFLEELEQAPTPAETIGRLYNVADDGLEFESLNAIATRAGYRNAAGLILEEPTTAPDELADEFEENGLNDVAEFLRENGAAETLRWLPGRILEAQEDDELYHHGEGFELGNLAVARERLEWLEAGR